MPLDRVLPLVVGWLLRETGHTYPDEIRAYLEEQIATISAVAFSRAIERRTPGVKAELRALRKAALA